jgi:hypothetical protein
MKHELSPVHSITLSARANSIAGYVKAARLGSLEVDHKRVFGRACAGSSAASRH